MLVFEDAIEVTIRADKVGTSSITWAWRIERDGELCVDGTMVVVHVDGDGRPTPLPDDVREKLSA